MVRKEVTKGRLPEACVIIARIGQVQAVNA